MKRGLVMVVVLGVFVPGSASAAPMDTWPVTHGIDCVGDTFNPVRPDGTRDPDGDPEPGSDAWIERDRQRLECDNQRDHDRRWHPHATVNSARYGEDWYRQPVRFDGTRFRYTYVPSGQASGMPNVGAAEVYRPCAPGTCGTMPPTLRRIEPPYPVVLIWHGAIAQMGHHRFNAQTFAEAGYLAIAINGTEAHGAPNFPNSAAGGEILDWLASDASGQLGREADLDRVAFTGHSAGAGAAGAWQGDPRVHAFIAWDSNSLGDVVADENCTGSNPCAPILYERTDGAFSAAQNTARTGYPENRDRGLVPYQVHKERGMDVMHIAFRATNHIDWNGNGVGSLAGNRLAEPLINYYNLAWLDRHLQGRLAFDGEGAVIASSGRTEAEERAYRQAQAQDAFDRLVALRFPAGSIDKHTISQGFYDPVQHARSGDPLWGGNVPYTIEGLWTTDRLAQEFRSYCSVSVPDYVGGSDGQPGSPVAARADSGPGPDDMRIHGCPLV